MQIKLNKERSAYELQIADLQASMSQKEATDDNARVGLEKQTAIKNEIISLTDRLPSTGALHTALHRLMNKGFIITDEGYAAKDRGRPKIYFSLSPLGKNTLVKARNLRNELFERIPNLIN